GVAQGDDRLDDRRFWRDVVDTLDERAVELDHVDREPAQIAERRMAGAEVVDGHLEARLTETVERAHGFVVSERKSLGDLELQELWVEATGGDDVEDLVVGARPAQPSGREVHTHDDRS